MEESERRYCPIKENGMLRLPWPSGFRRGRRKDTLSFPPIRRRKNQKSRGSEDRRSTRREGPTLTCVSTRAIEDTRCTSLQP